MLVSCAAHPKTRLIDPFPLRFPLVEAGTLEIDGHIAGQPRARDGIVYYATKEGDLTAVVARSRSILWRRPVDGADPDSVGQAGSPVDAAGPALKIEGTRLRAIDGADRILWEFAAEGTISVEPVTHDGRVYFGDSDRMFYCLDAATGKVKWRRRLQGAPLHAAVIKGRTVAVAASNSVIYFLSRKGGSILSWQAIPSRVVYEPAVAGPTLLVSSAAEALLAFDLKTARRIGQVVTSGTPTAGALWVPPFVILFEESPEPGGRERIVFLRSR